MGLAPLAKIVPVGLVGPECVARLGGGRKFLSLPAEQGQATFIGYGCKRRDLWQCAILSRCHRLQGSSSSFRSMRNPGSRIASSRQTSSYDVYGMYSIPTKSLAVVMTSLRRTMATLHFFR